MADPVAELLRKQPIPDAVRAQAWDAFESAKDADELAAALQALKMPDAAKASLWDLKAQTPMASHAAPEPAQTPEGPGLLQRAANFAPMAGGVVGGLIGGPFGAAVGGAAGQGVKTTIQHAAEIPGAIRDVAGNLIEQPVATIMGGLHGAREGVSEAATAGAVQGVGDAVGGAVVSKIAAPVGKYLKNKATDTMIAALGPAGRGTGPTGAESLALAKKVAPKLLDRNFGAVSHASALTKVGESIDRADTAIDTIMAGLPAGSKIPTRDIIAILRAEQKAGQVVGSSGRAVSVGAGEVKNDILEEVVKKLRQVGPYLSPEQAIKFRQQLAPLSKWSALSPNSENLRAEGYQAAYNGVRNALESLDPKIGPANQEISFWLNVNKIIEKSSNRAQAPSSGMGGAVIGAMTQVGGQASTGGVLGAAVIGRYVQRAMRSPGWRFASANVKDALANAILSNNLARVGQITGQIASGATAMMTSHGDNE